MRAIALMIVAFVALGACQNGQPEKQVAEAAVASGPGGVEPLGVGIMCPIRWSCDDESYYSTQGQCLEHCQGTCSYGYDCRGECICE